MQKKSLTLIQLLRGIASLLVVCYHVTSNVNLTWHIGFLGNIFAFGGSGVDIFFVLSGFIITYTNKTLLNKASHFFTFIRRRFIRIFPVYWIIISIYLLLQILLPAFYKTPYDLNVFNLISTYFLFPDHVMINGVSWTLTYELFFYFLFALAFLIRAKKVLWVLSVFYVLLIIFQYVLLAPFDNKWMQLVLYPMNVEFFMGIAVALLVPLIPIRFALTFIISGIVLFIIGAIISNNHVIFFNNNFQRVVLFGVPAFFIILGVVKYELTSRINMHNLLLLLGEASYTLYLFHLPVIAALAKIAFKLNLQNPVLINLIFIILIILVCAASILFYMLIEKPLIKKLNASPSTARVSTKKVNNIS